MTSKGIDHDTRIDPAAVLGPAPPTPDPDATEQEVGASRSSSSLSSLSSLASPLSGPMKRFATSSGARLSSLVGRSSSEDLDLTKLSYEKRHGVLYPHSSRSQPFNNGSLVVKVIDLDADSFVAEEKKVRPSTTVAELIAKYAKNRKRELQLFLPLNAAQSGSNGVWLKNDYPLFMYDVTASGSVGPLELHPAAGGDGRTPAATVGAPVVLVASNIVSACGGPVVAVLNGGDTVDSVLRDYNMRLHLGKQNDALALYYHSISGQSHWLPAGRTVDECHLPEMAILAIGEKPLYHLEVIGASREVVVQVDGNQSVRAVIDTIVAMLPGLGYNVQTTSGQPPFYFLSYQGRSVANLALSFGALHVKQTEMLELRAILGDEEKPPSLTGSSPSLSSAPSSPLPSSSSQSQSQSPGGGELKGQSILRIRVKVSPNGDGSADASLQQVLSSGYSDPMACEQVLRKIEGVTFLQMPLRRPNALPILGDLFITNMHLAFGPYRKGFPRTYGTLCKVPLFAIARLEKVTPPTTLSRAQTYALIDVYCKDFRQLQIGIDRSKCRRADVYTAISELAFPTSFLNTCAFEYKPQLPAGFFNGWDVYIPDYEIQRQNIPPGALWRTSVVNAGYELCDSYPNKIIVPESISDQQLAEAARFRSRGRIPILSYYHPNTASITRCSQPMPGLTGVSSPADQQLVEAIRKTNKSNALLYIYDCRPKANAMGNQALGMGYEATGAGTGYVNCRLEFLNIANIHVMRKSLQQIYSLVIDPSCEPRFWSLLEQSGWLQHIQLLLSAASKLSTQIDRDGVSVLIHCSDGWDRTAQISSLCQILLCETYRTIEGFQILIEKDWLSMGHKFHQRTGHGDKNHGDEQRAPIFLQFIDAVWQLLQQFPCSFEFNERFLIKILDALYSCHYGTFLCNSESARRSAELKRKTISLWTDIARSRPDYMNLLYIPEPGILSPFTGPERIALWTAYYFRWKYPASYKLDLDMRLRQMVSQHEEERTRTKSLDGQITELYKQIAIIKKMSDSTEQLVVD